MVFEIKLEFTYLMFLKEFLNLGFVGQKEQILFDWKILNISKYLERQTNYIEICNKMFFYEIYEKWRNEKKKK